MRGRNRGRVGLPRKRVGTGRGQFAAAFACGNRREGQSAVALDQHSQLQVPDLDGLGLEIAGEQGYPVDADQRVGRSQDQLACRVADIQTVGTRAGAPPCSSIAVLLQGNRPAGADAGGDRLRHASREAPEAHGTGRQTHVENCEAEGDQHDNGKHDIERTAHDACASGLRLTDLRRRNLSLG